MLSSHMWLMTTTLDTIDSNISSMLESIAPAYHMNGKVVTSLLLTVHLCGYLFICLKNVMSCAITFFISRRTQGSLWFAQRETSQPTCIWQSNHSGGCQRTRIAEIPLKMPMGLRALDEGDLSIHTQKIQMIRPVCFHLFTLPALSARTSEPRL